MPQIAISHDVPAARLRSRARTLAAAVAALGSFSLLPATPARAAASLPPAVVAAPTGAPKGVLLELHGGGWHSDPARAQSGLDYVRDRWVARGWIVYSTSYDPLAGSLDSVTRVYDAVRARSQGLPVIVAGQSAGGHLALMLAARRAPDGVIAEGAPTDLVAPAPPFLRGAITEAWGLRAGVLTTLSPARSKLAISGRRVLLSHSGCDGVVPPAHMTAYGRAHPHATTVSMPCGGTRPYTHADTTEDGFARLTREERAIVGRVVADRRCGRLAQRGATAR